MIKNGQTAQCKYEFEELNRKRKKEQCWTLEIAFEHCYTSAIYLDHTKAAGMDGTWKTFTSYGN